MKTKTKRPRLETVLAEILAPYFPAPDSTAEVVAFELWSEGDGGLSVNSAWSMRRDATLPETIEALRARWEVFKLNYAPRARVSDMDDANYSGPEFSALLECGTIPFAEVRPCKA
jgi:hypothetical protein